MRSVLDKDLVQLEYDPEWINMSYGLSAHSRSFYSAGIDGTYISGRFILLPDDINEDAFCVKSSVLVMGME